VVGQVSVGDRRVSPATEAEMIYSHPTRRRLLQIGTLGCLGLNLPRLLQAETGRSQTTRSAGTVKSCIVLFYYGGPSHLDTWDLKPDSPAEIRGEFRPIATRAAGVRICEHLHLTARVMDKLAIIRSLHHGMTNHNAAAVETLCGRTPLKGDLELLADDPNSFPCYGSALSYLTPGMREVPVHVALPHLMRNVVVLPGQNAGFLGAAHNPFQIDRDPNEPGFRVDELELPAGVSPDRLADRRSLLSMLDAQARHVDRMADKASMTPHHAKAFDLLRSEKVRRAFDLSQESELVR